MNLLGVHSLHALAYCERLFYLENVELIRLADARVYAGRTLHVEIARVFAPFLPDRPQICFNFRAPDPQHRPNDRDLGGTAAFGCAPRGHGSSRS